MLMKTQKPVTHFSFTMSQPRALLAASAAVLLAATSAFATPYTDVQSPNAYISPAFLGIFGWGLFASTLVPSLAIGLNWAGATRAGAIASIVTGMAVTLGLESLAWFGVFRFPAGVTAAALALVASVLFFGAVSLATKRNEREEIDADLLALIEGQPGSA